jgi:hypothetical protein
MRRNHAVFACKKRIAIEKRSWWMRSVLNVPLARILVARILVASMAVCAALIFANVPAHAQQTQLTSTYKMSLMGIPVGTANLSASVSDLSNATKSYQVDANARLSGLAGVFSSGRGSSTAQGTLEKDKLWPSRFQLLVRSGKAPQTLNIQAQNGDVKSVVYEPPAEPKLDRVPLTDAHRRNIIDPLGAFLVPLSKGQSATDPQVCARTLPVFDGTSRFDLAFSFSETRTLTKAQTGNYEGSVLVCKARYIPIAGHRPKRDAVKFMQNNKDMEIWLAPIGNTRVLAPYRVAVRTMIGMAVLEAEKFDIKTP